jgi:hypothetical protein
MIQVIQEIPSGISSQRALSSSETSVVTRATWRNNPEDAILHSHRHENLKSYKQMQFAIRMHVSISY